MRFVYGAHYRGIRGDGKVDARQNFLMFAAYNAWANGRLYAAAGELDAKAWRSDCGAFFKSMMGTLNHILVGDRVWMKRFTGEGTQPPSLDAILHEDFTSLLAAREAEDRRIIAFVDGLTEEAVAGRFTYTTMTDLRTVSQRLAPALAHFFNHQTHHRGQAHTILSILGRTPPELDLIYFFRAPEGRAYA
ncbi:MAG: damage-inducible protein DinB [Notoacmeibacter sp.]|nr:damage-inducible protein DinB [Notoacmeibacter sp.]